jgi:hypothetical protein
MSPSHPLAIFISYSGLPKELKELKPADEITTQSTHWL